MLFLWSGFFGGASEQAKLNKHQTTTHNNKKGAAADPALLKPSELVLLTSLPSTDDEVVAFLTPRLGARARAPPVSLSVCACLFFVLMS